MSPRQLTPALPDEQLYTISRALADARRFAILQQVAASPPSLACSALQQHQQITAPTISHHLKELNEAGLITIEREGRTARLTFNRLLWNAYRKRLAAL